jgi:hypothetical protein
MRFENDGRVQPAGTQFLGLIDSLIDIVKEPGVSDVEVMFTSLKVDGEGKRIVEAGQNVADTRYIGIKGLNDETKDKLREMYQASPLVSLMVLWKSDGKPRKKIGMLKFQSFQPGHKAPTDLEYEKYEKQANWRLPPASHQGMKATLRTATGSSGVSQMEGNSDTGCPQTGISKPTNRYRFPQIIFVSP